MGDLRIGIAVREALVAGTVGDARVGLLAREALVGGTLGDVRVALVVREALCGTVDPAGAAVIPRRAAQIIG